MKLTEEQADDMRNEWVGCGCKGNLWDFIQSYDFPFPDTGWKNWAECPPTKEDGVGNHLLVVAAMKDDPPWMEPYHTNYNVSSGVFWIRSPFWTPKQDQLHLLIENADSKTKELIRKAYELGKSHATS